MYFKYSSRENVKLCLSPQLNSWFSIRRFQKNMIFGNYYENNFFLNYPLYKNKMKIKTVQIEVTIKTSLIQTLSILQNP